MTFPLKVEYSTIMASRSVTTNKTHLESSTSFWEDTNQFPSLFKQILHVGDLPPSGWLWNTSLLNTVQYRLYTCLLLKANETEGIGCLTQQVMSSY